jgi:hypothetical protein
VLLTPNNRSPQSSVVLKLLPLSPIRRRWRVSDPDDNDYTHRSATRYGIEQVQRASHVLWSYNCTIWSGRHFRNPVSEYGYKSPGISIGSMIVYLPLYKCNGLVMWPRKGYYVRVYYDLLVDERTLRSPNRKMEECALGGIKK